MSKPAVVKGEPRSLVKTNGEDGILLPLKPTQRPQLVATDRMGRRRALLDPADMQGRGLEVDLVPAKVGELTQAVREGQQDHGGRRDVPSGSSQRP